MTTSQIVYIAALFTILALCRPGRLTVAVMVGNLAATLATAGSMDLGLVGHRESLSLYMLWDLASAAAVVFTAPVLAFCLAAAVPVYAIGLIAELPRGTTLGIVQLLALIQLSAIAGGYGGGGGSRNRLRRFNPGWGNRGGGLRGALVSREAKG